MSQRLSSSCTHIDYSQLPGLAELPSASPCCDFAVKVDSITVTCRSPGQLDTIITFASVTAALETTISACTLQEMACSLAKGSH